MTDPVDDFARGPEVSDDRPPTGIETLLNRLEAVDEILSVLKPFAEEAERLSESYRRSGMIVPALAQKWLDILVAARDLYLKLGGVL